MYTRLLVLVLAATCLSAQSLAQESRLHHLHVGRDSSLAGPLVAGLRCCRSGSPGRAGSFRRAISTRGAAD